MVFTLTGADRFPSAAYALLEGSSGFGRPIVAAAGSGPYDPKATRWGGAVSPSFLRLDATAVVWLHTS